MHDACSVVLGELARMDRVIDRLLLLESAAEPGFVSPAPVNVAELIDELYTALAERRRPHVDGGGGRRGHRCMPTATGWCW